MTIFRNLVSFAIFGMLLTFSSHAFGQGLPPVQPGPGPQPQPQPQPQAPAPQVPANNNNQGLAMDGGITGQMGAVDALDIDLSDDTVMIESAENTRNQGFVGSTTASIQNADTGGFVGAATDQSGPPLVDGASFGGGVNSSQTINSLQPAQVNLNQQFTTPDNQVIVMRRSIRARLRPSFYAPRPSAQQVSTRFNSRFVRQPGSQIVGSGYTVRVENRTATLTGMVNSRTDSERLVRQLRLEPGVYRIVNQLQVNSSNQQ